MTIPQEFDCVLSLGQACDTSAQIRRVFGQTASFPFDSMGTPLSALVSMLRLDFANFMLDSRLVQEHNFVFDTTYQTYFKHEFKNLKEFRQDAADARAKYQRRIDRWRQTLSSTKRILLVRSQQYPNEDVISEVKARQLLAVLRGTYPTALLHLMALNPAEAGIPEVRESDLSLLPIVPPEPFLWWGDNDEWDKAFRSVAITPPKDSAAFEGKPFRQHTDVSSDNP